MKKALGIIGFALIAGAIVYVFLSKGKKPPSNVATPSENEYDVSLDNKLSTISSDDVCDDNINLGKTKSSAIGTMATRHEAASVIMRDSVETIREQSKIDENDDLQTISTGLDELLREE